MDEDRTAAEADETEVETGAVEDAEETTDEGDETEAGDGAEEPEG